MHDYSVLIGRFQPLHRGHVSLIQRALSRSKQVIICIGSANSPISTDNPYTYEERKLMIRTEFGPAEPIHFAPIDDYLYNDGAWVTQVEATVNRIIRLQSDDPDEVKIALTGFDKDSTSFYLRFFPDWIADFSDIEDPYAATDIREHFYRLEMSRAPDRKGAYISPDMLYGSDLGFTDYTPLFTEPEIYQKRLFDLAKEWDFDRNYDPSKFPIFVNTVDTVVTANNHILLVQRKHAPGKGLWALPGGHVNPDERFKDAAIRELIEETNIDRSKRVLRANIVDTEQFDHPKRSKRARVVTMAYHIRLPDEDNLPDIQAADDAADARWWPIGDIRKNFMFEDHADIATYFLRSL